MKQYKNMFNRKLKERIKLLEYENEIIMRNFSRLVDAHPEVKDSIYVDSNSYIYRTGMDYDTLRRKYRDCEIKFNNDLK